MHYKNDQQRELRFLAGKIEVRKLETEGQAARNVISGLGIVHYDGTDKTEFRMDFDGMTFIERILPGAADEAIKGDIRCLYNHDANFVLGRTKSRTLRLTSGGPGVAYENELPATGQASDILASIARGDIDGSSFSFRIQDSDEKITRQGDTFIREIVRISEMFDVGPVAYPAYTATSAGVQARDIAAAVRSMKELSKDPANDKALAALLCLTSTRARLLEIDARN